jgi:hypothetical protein
MDVSDRDDLRVVQRLRAAEAALDERPSPRVRQAVMRVAADAVRKGAARRAMSAVRAWSAARWLQPRWRWSMPLAASVLVGAIAVGLVSEVQRASVPSGATGAASPQSEIEARSKPEAPPPAAPAPASTASAMAPLRATPELSRSGGAVTPQRDALAPAPVLSGKVITAPSEIPAARAEAPVSAPISARKADRAAAQATAKEETPQQWIDRIVAMRREGRQDQADRELIRLRERFPGVVVPPAALRP